jgi:hypothetical protein
MWKNRPGIVSKPGRNVNVTSATLIEVKRHAWQQNDPHASQGEEVEKSIEQSMADRLTWEPKW